MRELIERLEWWLKNQPDGQDIPVPRAQARRAVQEWHNARCGLINDMPTADIRTEDFGELIQDFPPKGNIS